MVFQRVAHYKFPTQFMMYIQCISKRVLQWVTGLEAMGPATILLMRIETLVIKPKSINCPSSLTAGLPGGLSGDKSN